MPSAYLPDELRSYKHTDGEATSMILQLAADLIEHHIKRGDDWFAIYLKQVEAEAVAARRAEDLAAALRSYLVRSDLAPPMTWVLDTYARYQEWRDTH